MPPPPASEYDFDEAGEDSPFLGGGGRESAESDRETLPPPDDNAPRKLPGTWYQAKSPGAVVVMLSVILFLLVLSATLAMMPLVRLMEDRLCREHYGTTEPVDEAKCKVGDVQSQLAWLGGIAGVVDAVVGTSSALGEGERASLRLTPRLPRTDRFLPLGHHVRHVRTLAPGTQRPRRS